MDIIGILPPFGRLNDFCFNQNNKMKIAIIGAGNMGGSIARGLAKGTVIQTENICVSNPSRVKLDALKAEYPAIQVTHSNVEAAKNADIVLLAVKPWLIEQIVKELPLDEEKQMLVSVAAGITFAQYEEWVGEKMPVFRVIPNTAISQLESMTLIASHHASKDQEQLLLDIFNEMGLAMQIPEKQMAATTALTSCGIAYVLKYIQAAMQAGIELGVYPKDAQRMVAQSVKGAASLILNNDTHPSVEIDKVTTPGGITIRGINELEHEGFSSAIIKAMKASCVK